MEVRLRGDSNHRRSRSLRAKCEDARFAAMPSLPDDAPYRALWQSVIMQALIDAASGSKKAEIRKAKLEAAAWFHKDNEDFLEVCVMAGFSPERTMQGAGYAMRQARKVRTAEHACLHNRQAVAAGHF